MNEPSSPTLWKRIALRSFFGGVGIAVTLAAVAGGGIWYESRPKLPKPWSTHSIVSTAAPAFHTETWVSKDGKTTRPIIVLQYTLQNNTDTDYKIEARTDLKLTGRMPDGAVTPDLLSDNTNPTENHADDITVPIFIPAKQKSFMVIHFADNDLPVKKTGESDQAFHERLRAYLNMNYAFVGFSIFDDVNRFEIDLPKWLDKPAVPN